MTLESSPEGHKEGVNLRKKHPDGRNSKYEDSEEECMVEKQVSSTVKKEERGSAKKTSLKRWRMPDLLRHGKVFIAFLVSRRENFEQTL